MKVPDLIAPPPSNECLDCTSYEHCGNHERIDRNLEWKETFASRERLWKQEQIELIEKYGPRVFDEEYDKDVCI